MSATIKILNAVKDTILHPVIENWIASASLALLLLPILTYLTTSIQSAYAIRSAKHGKLPPVIPYWFPYFGNLFPFLRDVPGFMNKIVKTFGNSVPVRVKIGPASGYLILSADHIVSFLKASRGLSPKPGAIIAYTNFFGAPPSMVSVFTRDDSGIGPTPSPGSKVKAENRIWHLQHMSAHQYLSGTALNAMSMRFMANLGKGIAESEIGYEWVEKPDLYVWLRHQAFRAAAEALCGPHFLSLNPGLVEDYWDYVYALPALFKGLPRWLDPEPYRKRDKVLNAVKRWHRFAREHSDHTKCGTDDPEWDEYWGSKYMKVRHTYAQGIEGFRGNDDAIAIEDLTLIFATNTNAIPSAAWFLIHMYQEPKLLLRVRSEVNSARINNAENGTYQFDLTKLNDQPLLQSVYAETLRLRISLAVARTSTEGDYKLAEWTFPKKSIIGLSSRIAATNKNIWNTGGEGDPHPLEEFWADRFLVYPDDPLSGPRKVSTSGKQKTVQEIHTSKPTFTMDGLQGGWIPYGGGQWMCPGRHFAKAEMLGNFAMMFSHYDIELLVEPGFKAKENMDFFLLGAMPPKDKISFRIRRRRD